MQSDFTLEEARLLMVGDIFLFWDGLGVGVGVVGNCRKNSCTKKERQKNIMQSD